MYGGEYGSCSGCVGEGTVGCGEYRWCSSSVGKGTACGGESGWGSGGDGDVLFEVGRSEVVKSRWAEHEGGDGRSGGGAKAADAANRLRAAKR